MANMPADQIFEPDQLRRCECRLCGNGRCAVFVHPIASLLATRLQVEDRDPVLNMPPVMCEDCLEHFLLERKRDAVKRSREKRKFNTEKNVGDGCTEDSDVSRKRGRPSTG